MSLVKYMSYNCGIYIIINKINQHCYIGSSYNITKRLNRHKLELRTNKHHSKYLQNAYDKYGVEAFTYKTLLFCDRDNLLLYEQKAFLIYKPEYNICTVAASPMAGRKHSEESKLKMSISQIGNTCNKGKTLTEEQKKKCSLALTGRKHSEETKRKIGLKHKGKIVSDETKSKISLAKQNITEATRLNMSISSLGNTRALGCKRSEETKLKLKEAWVKRRANK